MRTPWHTAHTDTSIPRGIEVPGPYPDQEVHRLIRIEAADETVVRDDPSMKKVVNHTQISIT